jgi:hypothetical protein
MSTEPCPPPEWDEIDDLEPPDTLKSRINERDTFRVALAERVDYLMIAASTVGGARLTQQDASRLRRLCNELELTESETERILTTASSRRVEEPPLSEGQKSRG